MIYLRSLIAVAVTHVLRPFCALFEAAIPDEPYDDPELTSGIFEAAADRQAEQLRAELEDDAAFLARMRLPRGGAT